MEIITPKESTSENTITFKLGGSGSSSKQSAGTGKSWRRLVPQEKLRCPYQKRECSLDE